MNTHAFEKKLHSLKARFGLQLFVLAAVVCTSWIVTDHANAVYILTGPEDAAIVLNEEEVREGEMSSQLVYLSSGQSGYDMALTAGQEVTVTHDGSTVTAKARSETVAELLERLHNTDGSGILTLTDGTTLNFSGVKSMTATAYTAGHGGADYTTATGTLVKVGTVAVDKNVIPLGTKMYIVAADGSVVYGTAVAADTGVRGNIVDLYYDTYQQCINFGRRTCNVYILE